MKTAKLLHFISFIFQEAILTTCALFLCKNSFTGTLAYDFCFAFGLCAWFSSGLVTTITLDRVERRKPLRIRDLQLCLLSSLMSLILPLFLVLSFASKYKTCDVTTGLYWFLLLPVISSIFGLASAMWAKRKPYRLSVSLIQAFLPFIAFSILTLIDLLISPQLSFLHPALGYFAGPIYDELVEITGFVVSYRLWVVQLSFIMICPLIFRMFTSRRHLRIAWLLMLLLVLIPLTIRGKLNWHHNFKDVHQVLSKTSSGKLVDIRFAPNSLNQSEINSIHTHLDFHAEQILKDLPQLALAKRNKPQVYIYPDVETKFHLTGTRNTMIGNPIHRIVHVLKFMPERSFIRHELTHVFASSMGYWGLSPKIALIEGLATAIEYQRQGLSVHEWAAVMEQEDLAPNIETLFTPIGFFAQHASRSYLYIGSFCRWLLDQHGSEKFAQVYKNANFEQVYQQSLTKLIQTWKQMLLSTPISEASKNLALSILLQKGVTQKTCVHDVALLKKKAGICSKNKDYACSIAHLKQAHEFSEQDPIFPYQIAKQYLSAENFQEASKQCLRTLESDQATELLKVRTLVLLGDLDVLQNNNDAARLNYQRPKLEEIPTALKLSLLARQQMLNEDPTLIQELVSDTDISEWTSRILQIGISQQHSAILLYAALQSSRIKEHERVLQLLSYITEKMLYAWDRDLRHIYWSLVAQSHEALGNKQESIKNYRLLQGSLQKQGVLHFVNNQIERLTGSLPNASNAAPETSL